MTAQIGELNSKFYSALKSSDVVDYRHLSGPSLRDEISTCIVSHGCIPSKSPEAQHYINTQSTGNVKSSAWTVVDTRRIIQERANHQSVLHGSESKPGMQSPNFSWLKDIKSFDTVDSLAREFCP